MNEYIEKKAVADRLFECSRNEEIPLSVGIGFLAAADEVVAFPASDVVPVVRCKDCEMQSGCKSAQYLGNNGFCSHGERKGADC